MSTFESLVFYRGVAVKYPVDRPSVLTPRRDRRPKNSPPDFHDATDQWFKGRFGIAYRSQGVFLTSSLVAASAYAATPHHLMRIIPLSPYRYCWSPTVSDLLFAANQLPTFSADVIGAYLDVASYREVELLEAHRSGHEVMLYCEQYIAIPIQLLGKVAAPVGTSIILSA